jgi:hypothetical protein
MPDLVLLRLIFAATLLGTAIARRALLPLSRSVQGRWVYSDQVVTELSIAVPSGVFIGIFTFGLSWLFY